MENNVHLKFSINCLPALAERLRVERWHFAVMGNQSVLGQWKVPMAVMESADFRQFSVTVYAQNFLFPLEYKYVIIDAQQHIVTWEIRENRFTDGKVFEKGEDVCFTDNDICFDIPPFRAAGVALPIFSLRSEESFGIGEFLDLKLMVDWAVSSGLHIIQTLPVNDTTLTHTQFDSYPYNVLSVFALHPMYLRLSRLGVLKNETDRIAYQTAQLELNSLSKVDYERVNNLKWTFFRKIYKQEQKNLKSDKQYQKFVSDNKRWLFPYAVFSYCRDIYGSADVLKWKDLKSFSLSEVQHFIKKNPIAVGLYFFLQYHLYLQLKEVHEYAKVKGILLKGDIPIGVSPCSVDVWCAPNLFNLEVQAGAPPDNFSNKGQNWGFPTYNWEEMGKEDFAWWKDRLKMMSTYFDAYRIDHILGFFRIWEIPNHAQWGLLGQFNKALPLTSDNIEYYGIPFDVERCLKPYIGKDSLYVYFGEDADFVRAQYMTEDEDGNLRLRSHYDTQRKVLAAFPADAIISERDRKVRNGLMYLLCQVLFVPDNNSSDHFHPRILYNENESFKALSVSQKEGYIRLYEDFFYHRHNDFWKQQALNKLPVLVHSTSMLPCGEDLGMIPSCVPEVMQRLNLLSLEIQSMPKQYGKEFDNLDQIPYLSVCTTSTHDMSPLRLWWTEERGKVQRYFNDELHFEGVAPASCEPWIVECIINQHLHSQAMWTIFPIQDLFALDSQLSQINPSEERINVPDNPHNIWCYRMHISMEKLLASKEFTQKIKQMLVDAAR